MPVYAPEPITAFDSVEELQVYLMNELRRISDLFVVGQFQSIRFEQLNELGKLPKPRDGDLAYFTENAVGANQQGLYEFDENTDSWKKL